MSLLPRRSILRTPFLLIVAAVVFTGTTGTVAFAQHGGGHVGGGHLGGGHVAGGHFSGGHMSAPHGSASPRSHGMVSRASGDPPLAGFGTRSFVATPPPVRLSPRPGANRPIVGNRVTMLPFLPSQAEPQVPGATHSWPFHFPRRPRFPQRPVFPTFAPRTFGFSGSPFFGLGLGFGINSIWWPSCGLFWGWGYGCNSLPYYGFGFGYGPLFGAGNLGAQVQNEGGPDIYGNPPEKPSTFVYGEEARDLMQLYLKDGTIYNVTDYWLVNDQIHCNTVEGATSIEHVFDFAQLDLQTTVNVNTARGFHFVLRNEPLEQYLSHPDTGSSNGAPPQTGPAGPLQPPQ